MEDINKNCEYCNNYYPESKFGISLTTSKKIYRRNKCNKCYRKTKNELRKKYRKWITDYKKNKKCDICGIKDFRVLEFHHKNNLEKKFSIGNSLTNSCGIEKIKKEISKCKILCANCHRILHFKNK